jgi:hypothetical protein
VFGSLRPQRAGRKVRRNALRLGLVDVARTECVRQRAIGGVPKMAAECVMFAWPSLVDGSCSFGRNVNCDKRWSDVSCCREKRMVVWIEGGCLECVRALSSGCSPNTFGLDGNDEVG